MWDIVIVTCISCLAIFVHNLYQCHPPMPKPPQRLLRRWVFGGTRSQINREGDYPSYQYAGPLDAPPPCLGFHTVVRFLKNSMGL